MIKIYLINKFLTLLKILNCNLCLKIKFFVKQEIFHKKCISLFKEKHLFFNLKKDKELIINLNM